MQSTSFITGCFKMKCLCHLKLRRGTDIATGLKDALGELPERRIFTNLTPLTGLVEGEVEDLVKEYSAQLGNSKIKEVLVRGVCRTDNLW